MGDFNAKVVEKKEENILRPYGLGIRNNNGEILIELFCREEGLMIANTWFEQRPKNRHTWVAPDKVIKQNQIDYILVSHRYRNGIKNATIRPSADCGSDHHLVMTKLEVKLKKIKKSPKKSAWNKRGTKNPL